MKKLLFFIFAGVVFFITTFFINLTLVKAQVSTNDYNIEIVGNGKTYSNIITIRAQTQTASNANNDLVCYGNENDGWGSIAFNNSGGPSYKFIGNGECRNGWSYFQWDVTGYDGNVNYGLKTIYIRLFNYGGAEDFTSRSVVYEKQPDPTPPPPAPSTPPTQSTTKKSISTPKAPAAPAAPVQETPKIAETVTPAPQPEVSKSIEGTATSKNNNKYYYLLIIPVLALILGSFLLGKKYQRTR